MLSGRRGDSAAARRLSASRGGRARPGERGHGCVARQSQQAMCRCPPYLTIVRPRTHGERCNHRNRVTTPRRVAQNLRARAHVHIYILYKVVTGGYSGYNAGNKREFRNHHHPVGWIQTTGRWLPHITVWDMSIRPFTSPENICNHLFAGNFTRRPPTTMDVRPVAGQFSGPPDQPKDASNPHLCPLVLLIDLDF
jgi:hypothetical protein